MMNNQTIIITKLKYIKLIHIKKEQIFSIVQLIKGYKRFELEASKKIEKIRTHIILYFNNIFRTN